MFADENLDRLLPISKQPKDKVQAILDACERQFPDFVDRSRKRLRTYLKSCRRVHLRRINSSDPKRKANNLASINEVGKDYLLIICDLHNKITWENSYNHYDTYFTFCIILIIFVLYYINILNYGFTIISLYQIKISYPEYIYDY